MSDTKTTNLVSLEINAKQTNKQKPTLRYTVLKLQIKDLKKSWKKPEEKKFNLSAETMKARGEMNEIFKVLTEKRTHQPRILLPVKLSFKS